MKRLLSLALVGTFCFFGLSLTGCGGPGENTVVEAAPETVETKEYQMDYEAEMKKSMQEK